MAINYPQLLKELEDLTRQLQIEVRYEKGDFEGGYCILKDKKILVINKRLPDPRRAAALAQALGEYGIETTYVKPNLRAYIDDEVAKVGRSR